MRLSVKSVSFAWRKICAVHIFLRLHICIRMRLFVLPSPFYRRERIVKLLPLFKLQPNALRRSALIQGKAPFYRREHTTAYVTKKKGALTTQEGAYTQCPRGIIITTNC